MQCRYGSKMTQAAPVSSGKALKERVTYLEEILPEIVRNYTNMADRFKLTVEMYKELEANYVELKGQFDALGLPKNKG